MTLPVYPVQNVNNQDDRQDNPIDPPHELSLDNALLLGELPDVRSLNWFLAHDVAIVESLFGRNRFDVSHGESVLLVVSLFSVE